MKWSTKIARVAGIDIFVHATFLIIVAWAAYAGWASGGTLAAVLFSTFFVLALFACVVLHELGHALAARRYGIGTHDITLLPIGGVARLERIPEKPGQEIVVALAGPAVNVAIVALLGAWLWLTAGVGSALLEPLLFVNIALVMFNMIPAFPLDGGRVLRASLALRMNHARATAVAARIGKGFAILFGIVGLFSNIFLAIIAVFVWFSASREADLVRLRSALGARTVDDAMLTSFRMIEANESVGRARALARADVQRDFPVVLRGTLVGLLRREDLFQDLPSDTPVHEVMQREILTLATRDRLRDVFPHLAATDTETFPVVWRGELVGLLTKARLSDFLRMPQPTARRAPRARPHGAGA